TRQSPVLAVAPVVSCWSSLSFSPLVRDRARSTSTKPPPLSSTCGISSKPGWQRGQSST
ncbi:unnamed protein product, partial [Mycena citricolor]